MLAQLQDQLAMTQPPEMMTLYERANNLFDDFDLLDYTIGYQDLLSSVDGAADGLGDPRDESIYSLTFKYLRQIADEHQIRLSDEATMLNYITVLEFVKQIEHTELVQQCADALANDETDNLDKFGLCMLFVSSVELEDSMIYLEEIPDCVIKTMRGYFDGRVALEVETESLDPAVRQIYKELDKFVRTIAGQDMHSYKYLFEQEGETGLPFPLHYKDNEDYLLKLPVQQLVYELIGFALISEGGLNNPQQVIMDCLGKSITDLDRITTIQYLISTTLIEYRNTIASGVGIVV